MVGTDVTTTGPNQDPGNETLSNPINIRRWKKFTVHCCKSEDIVFIQL